MATFYVIRGVRIGLLSVTAGALVDSNIVDTTALTNAGALLWPSSDATIAAAATKAQLAKLNGQNEDFCQDIMRDAVDSVQKTNDTQTLASNGVNVANVADDQVIGGIPVEHVIDIPDGVTADKDVILTHKTEITSVEVLKGAAAGGAADTIQVKNAATAVTDAMSINVAAKTIVRAATIDPAQSVIAAGGTLRVSKVKASANNVACKVVVRGVRRA